MAESGSRTTTTFEDPFPILRLRLSNQVNERSSRPNHSDDYMGRLKQKWNEMFAEAEREVVEEGCTPEAIARAEKSFKKI